MVLSLAVVFAVVAGVLAAIWRPAPDPVRVVDYRAPAASARAAADFPLVAPEGLPGGWRATSVRFQPEDGVRGPVWHVGFLTPGDAYAEVGQAGDAAGLLRARLPGWRVDGTVDVAGRLWQRRTDGTERALSRGGVLVSGTASYAELAVLAASLR